jgi:hypothetical protein
VEQVRLQLTHLPIVAVGKHIVLRGDLQTALARLMDQVGILELQQEALEGNDGLVLALALFGGGSAAEVHASDDLTGSIKGAVQATTARRTIEETAGSLDGSLSCRMVFRRRTDSLLRRCLLDTGGETAETEGRDHKTV